jgi:predicted ATPase
MELGPLGQKDLIALAELTLGSVPSDNMVMLLLQRSGGNPFFAEQMLLYLKEEGEIDNVDRYGRTSSLLPFNVRTLLISRLDRLPPAVKDAVQGAAVLGQEFDEHVLTFMFQNDVLLAKHVREAERAAIWLPVGQGRFRFRGGLLREAAYDMLPQARRRRLHLLAAEALEVMHAVDLAPTYHKLAYHYGRAEDEAKERYYAILAGEQAEKQFAHAQAADLYGRALALTDQGDQNAQYDLLCKRESIYDLLGDRKAQSHDLELLAEIAENLADDYKRAEVALLQDRFAEATRSQPPGSE